MGLTSYLALSTKVDWNDDGDFGDTGEDVSTYVRYPVWTQRGRAKVDDEFRAGRGGFQLRNEDGRFTPLYASSPLYPNVLPGRTVQVQVTYDGTTYPVFYGRCTPESQKSKPPGEVGFTMVDAFEQLRLGLTNTPLMTSVRQDEVITNVLDDINWPAGLRDLDTGPDTLGVFPNHNRLPVNALQLAAKQDPGAALFLSRAGEVVYQNRYFRSSQAVYATLAGTFDEIDPQLRQEDLADAVRATYPRFEVQTALQAVWTLQLPRWLPPGESTFEFENQVPATGYVTTLVANTDYTGNTELDGSGTDKTAQISLEVTASDSGGGTITATNLDSTRVALQAGAQVRAYAVLDGGEVNAVRKTVSSPLVAGQQLNRGFEFLDIVDVVSGYVDYQAAIRGAFRLRPVVTIRPDTDALMALVLGAEIGKRVSLTDTAAAWTTQISGEFIIEGIDLRITGPASVEAVWRLFDAELASAAFFRISGVSGGGADYSQISDSTPAASDRRIAY